MFTKHETGNVLAFPHFGKEKDTMKLLIVDDEKLTREGIRDSIARLSLPFDSILLNSSTALFYHSISRLFVWPLYAIFLASTEDKEIAFSRFLLFISFFTHK